MDTNINYKVFEGDGFFVDVNLLDGLNHEERQVWIEAMNSGHYANGIDVSKFLREDLSINLEKLELATTLAVKALEFNSPKEDITLNLINLQKYYDIRGITGNEKQEREERTFLLGFVSAIASEASVRDTLVVKFV